jgi:hypothetical protein
MFGSLKVRMAISGEQVCMAVIAYRFAGAQEQIPKKCAIVLN